MGNAGSASANDGDAARRNLYRLRALVSEQRAQASGKRDRTLGLRPRD